MVVNKRREYEVYQEQVQPAAATTVPKVNSVLRAKCLFFVIMVAALAMFVTVRSETIIRAGYDLVQMKAQLLKLEKENEALRLDIAKLKSPQRIQRIAVSDLGMVVPATVYYASNEAKVVQTGQEKQEQGLLKQIMSNVMQAGRAEASRGH